MSEAGTPKPGSDLATRFVAGVAMIAVAVLVTWLGGWWFRALAGAAAAIMLVEWADMHKVPRLWGIVGAVLLVAALLVGVEYLYPVGGADWLRDPASGDLLAYFDEETLSPNWAAFGGIAVLSLLLGLLSRRLAMIGGTVYVGIPSFAMLSLSWVWPILVFWVFVVTWATDILAYFAGRTIGGPKLAPRVSPNKTWAGLAGGIVGAGLCGWAMAAAFDMAPLFHWLGAPMGAVAQGGDLYESWVKRRAGVKDSGSLLPGHGGVLDRLDGLLAVALVTTLMLMAGLWTE